MLIDRRVEQLNSKRKHDVGLLFFVFAFVFVFNSCASHIFQRFVSVLDFETDLIMTPQYKVGNPVNLNLIKTFWYTTILEMNGIVEHA